MIVEKQIYYTSITEMASKYIIKYVDRRFSDMYWISGGRRGFGSIDYDEMPKLILYLMKKQLFIVFPFILENENNFQMYTMMKDTLNKLPDKMNTEYINIHNIDIEEIREDVVLTLAHIFRPTKNNNKKEK